MQSKVQLEIGIKVQLKVTSEVQLKIVNWGMSVEKWNKWLLGLLLAGIQKSKNFRKFCTEKAFKGKEFLISCKTTCGKAVKNKAYFY